MRLVGTRWPVRGAADYADANPPYSRKSGNIGGFYGNGIGGFHAILFTLDVTTDAAGRPTGLKLEDPATTLEPMTPDKPKLLAEGATGKEFLRAWRWDDWNEFRIRVEGGLSAGEAVEAA